MQSLNLKYSNLLVFLNRIPHIGHRCALQVVVGVLAAVLALVASSCHQDTRYCHSDDAHYAQVDSLLKGINDADSLASLAGRYHDQNDPTGEMLALSYEGCVLRRQSRFDKAIEVHSRVLEIAKTVADTVEMMSALNNMATDYRQKGELSEANGLFYKTLLLNDAYSNAVDPEALKVRAQALNGIGIIEIELRHFSMADSVLREALRSERLLGCDEGMAANYSQLGAIKRIKGENDSAWFYYRESLKYNQLADSKIGVALSHLHFGELCVDERNFSRAQVEFKQAYDQLKQLEYSYYWMKACLSLANVNLLLGEKEQAMHYTREAESEAQRIKSRAYLAEAYRLNYELALLSGNQQNALEYFVKSEALYDSIYGLEKNEEMRHQLNEYEANVKQGEMNVLNKDIKRLHRTRNLMGLFTILLIVMAGAIIAALLYATRVRLRTQRLMRQVEETRSLFFTNVVHQLRTPLTAIMGATDGIVAQAASQDDAAAARQRENVEIIERQGNHLLLLVDRILEVGSVRSALKGPDWRTGDVVGYLRMIVESYRESCVNRQIELTYASHEKEAEADLVPHYLNTILGNLIENAINYSKDYCKINVTSHVDNDQLIIKVSDNGIGIGADDLPHVFEAFYRAAPAEQLCEGVGIGLTVVHDMVAVLDGSVVVESTPGKGSVFTVTLPCRYHQHESLKRLEMVVDPVRNVVRKQTQLADNRDIVQSAGEQPIVLVVEDHADVARLVGAALGPAFTVHYASNGEQGLAHAAELLPDLIITDVKMPYMDGLEMCRRVRESRHLRHIPVIVLSARTSGVDRIRGIEAGADAYMVKPFVSDELRILATKLLENRKILKEAYSNTLSTEEAVPEVEDATQMGDEEFLAAFAGLVDQQMANGDARMNLGKIAVQLKMGESQLRRRILALTGKSAASYILQLRLEKAMRLLCDRPTMLIGDVAEQCGFSDVAYFSRVFRQHYKVTPTQARSSR